MTVFSQKLSTLSSLSESPGKAVGSCQLCGQPAGKLLTEGVRGREGGEEAGGGDESSLKFHSDPH